MVRSSNGARAPLLTSLPVRPWATRSRQALLARGLADPQFENIWAGRGTSAVCEHCRRTIEPHDIEYELRFRQGEAMVSIQLHRECWETWWRD